MKTSTIAERNTVVLSIFSALVLLFTFSISSSIAHAAMISTQLDLGSTGQEVTDLQTYLATNANWYPSGLVTGYFGAMTQTAVQKFQIAQGIVTSGTAATTGFGRVGPSTLTRLNTLMNNGNTSTLNTVPVLSPVVVQTGPTTITYSWTTNEPTTGQIYWGTSPIQSDEATGYGQTPYVSGTLALDAGGLQTSHVITVSNLMPHTMYYYFMRSIDASGDMSVVLSSSAQTTY